jgi:2-polyprenyl-6-methoxyphenol hydroxylase-like FAD-dependent oxidoreductase
VEIGVSGSPHFLLVLTKDARGGRATVVPMNRFVHDVVIVGSRVSGAATARLLAARGLDVLLVDRAAHLGDTLSTHGLARGAVVQLARWGLLDRVLDSGAPAVREVSFHLGDAVTRKAVKHRAGVDHLVAPRRHVLDRLLLDAAEEAGAETLLGATVTGVRREGGRVTGVTVRTRQGSHDVQARHVVGADGLRSTTARLFGAATRTTFDADVSLFYAYVGDVDWRGFEFHLAPFAFAGVFPTHDGEGCVWLSRPTARLGPVRNAGPDRLEAWVAMLEDVAPDLGARVRAGRVTSPVRGCVAPPNLVREAAGPGWSLVGDAGYHRDPITGHGITDAFRDAELLADALGDALSGEASERAALAAYQQERDRALGDTFRLTEALARFPEPPRFAELQRELAEALEREALWLASRPAPAGQLATYVA